MPKLLLINFVACYDSETSISFNNKDSISVNLAQAYIYITVRNISLLQHKFRAHLACFCFLNVCHGEFAKSAWSSVQNFHVHFVCVGKLPSV